MADPISSTSNRGAGAQVTAQAGAWERVVSSPFAAIVAEIEQMRDAAMLCTAWGARTPEDSERIAVFFVGPTWISDDDPGDMDGGSHLRRHAAAISVETISAHLPVKP